MKKIPILFLIAAVCIFTIFSCKKEENKIYLEGGTPPVLTASASDSVTLTSATAANNAITLTWTNPDYQLTTGTSSQNVTYNIELDTAGANFSNPLKQQITVSQDLSHTITVGDLNNYLASATKLALATDVAHNIEVRIVSTLANGSAPLASNILKFVAIPYETFAVEPPSTGELYITGDAVPSSWTNTPPLSQQLTKVSKGDFFITMDFQPGKQYKFLSNQGQWQPQYGGSSSMGDAIQVNLGNSSDPPGIPTPDVAGTYKVELDFVTGKYTVTKQ